MAFVLLLGFALSPKCFRYFDSGVAEAYTGHRTGECRRFTDCPVDTQVAKSRVIFCILGSH